jgi:hypothetical protein
MSYFADLTPYTYCQSDEDPPGTVNIGWLDRDHPFPTGPSSNGFRAKLALLCQRRVKITRGFHPCCFCNGPKDPIPTSNAEMRVAGNGRVYAAPSLIFHYVTAHNYRPPDEFIAAVLAWEED